MRVLTCISAADNVDIALFKPTVQSSTFSTYTASLAVDGNTDANFYGGNSCSHTELVGNVASWWEVDLLQVYSVKRVKVTTRIDYCTSARCDC